jgi:alcohol dehydrogenase class IV
VVAEAIRKLTQEVGIPGLDKFQVDSAALKQLTSGVLADDCALFGPKRASADQVLSMLKTVYES